MYLNLYEIVLNKMTGMPEFKVHPKIKKESTAKIVEMHYNEEQQLVSALSIDGKLEFYTINFDESVLLKKMVRVEKRKSLKRSKQTNEETRQKVKEDIVEEEEDEAPKETKVDKASLKADIEAKQYDMSMHFSKKSALEIESGAKARSFKVINYKKQKLHLIVSIGNKNQIYKYTYDAAKEEKGSEDTPFKAGH